MDIPVQVVFYPVLRWPSQNPASHLSPDSAPHLNVSTNSLVVPVILWYSFLLIFCTILLQWRFWSVTVAKLLKFRGIVQTPKVRFVGKAWRFAWPLCFFSHKHYGEPPIHLALWWRLEVQSHSRVYTCCFSECSPQIQLRRLLLQEPLLSFASP